MHNVILDPPTPTPRVQRMFYSSVRNVEKKTVFDIRPVHWRKIVQWTNYIRDTWRNIPTSGQRIHTTRAIALGGYTRLDNFFVNSKMEGNTCTKSCSRTCSDCTIANIIPAIRQANLSTFQMHVLSKVMGHRHCCRSLLYLMQRDAGFDASFIGDWWRIYMCQSSRSP